MNKHTHIKKDIYIIKNDINDKVYIGQTVNPKQRWEQYKSLVKKKPDTQVITRAMKKYGIEHFTMSIIEENVVNFNEREQYWIQYYNSIVPNGYNVADGGEGTGNGIYSPMSKIKSQNVLDNIIDDIIQNVLTLKEISEKYELNYDRIEEINWGRAYYNPNLNYPLRESKRFSEEKLKQITYSLKYELDKSLKQIAKEYDVDGSYLNDINQGRSHYRNYLTYPLRLGKMKKAEIIYPQIKDLLKNSQLSQKEIAQKLNVSQETVSGINQGKKGYDKNISYPIRKFPVSSKNKCLSKDIVDEIHRLLKETNLSLRKIGEMFEVSSGTIGNINTGSTKKYRDDSKYVYPIRK